MRNLMSASPPHYSSRVFLTVPAEPNDTGAGAGADDRPGLGDPVLDAVITLLHPVRHVTGPFGRVRVQGAGVDACALRNACLHELLHALDGALTRAHAIGGMHDAVRDLEDRLHLEHRAEERLRPAHTTRPFQVLERVRDGVDLDL